MRIRKPQERWFKVPGDPDKAEIKIKALTPGERFTIYDKAISQDVFYDAPSGTPQIKQTTDKQVDRMETAKAAVVNWKNVYEADGTTIMACTPENIEKAVNGIDGFLSFVRECMQRLDADIEDEKKDQEKNLLPT